MVCYLAEELRAEYPLGLVRMSQDQTQLTRLRILDLSEEDNVAMLQGLGAFFTPLRITSRDTKNEY